jgi:phosphonate transport system substrate-binding protein
MEKVKERQPEKFGDPHHLDLAADPAGPAGDAQGPARRHQEKDPGLLLRLRQGQPAGKRQPHEAVQAVGFKPSTNAQLVPIRQLELFKDRNKFEADTGMAAADKQLKIAEIDKKLAELSQQ